MRIWYSATLGFRKKKKQLLKKYELSKTFIPNHKSDTLFYIISNNRTLHTDLYIPTVTETVNSYTYTTTLD